MDKATGAIGDIFVASRPVLPFASGGCLGCNALISADKLQEEALLPDERRRKGYVDDPNVHAPSVITLNALACARRQTTSCMASSASSTTIMTSDTSSNSPASTAGVRGIVKALDTCLHCSPSKSSAYGRGDSFGPPLQDDSLRNSYPHNCQA